MLNCFSFRDFYASLMTIFTLRKKLKCTCQRDSLLRYFPLYFLCPWIKSKLLSNSAVLRKIFQILNMGPETSESKLYPSVCPCQFLKMDSIGLEYYIMYCTWIVGFDLLVSFKAKWLFLFLLFPRCQWWLCGVKNDSAGSTMSLLSQQWHCSVSNDSRMFNSVETSVPQSFWLSCKCQEVSQWYPWFFLKSEILISANLEANSKIF